LFLIFDTSYTHKENEGCTADFLQGLTFKSGLL
jgi:hypothetical protein